MKNKEKLFIYCCDAASYRGEGILANNFIEILEKVFKNFKIILYTPENKSFFFKKKYLNKKINHSFFYKYFTPILGIFKIWEYHLKGNKTVYVNYLPLWNFLLFLFLPQKTILGPITGGSYHGKHFSIKSILRKKIILAFYSISIFLIELRNFKCIFSSKLLLKYLPNQIKKKSLFNFQLYNLVFLKNKKKNIDIIYYNRNHYTKKNDKILYILEKLKKNFNILIVGDKVANFKNLGIIPRDKMINFLKKTKFVFSSPENQLSYFALDAIRCNVQIISTNTQKLDFFKSFFVFPKKLNEKNIKKIISLKNKKFKSKKLLQKIRINNYQLFRFFKNNYGH